MLLIQNILNAEYKEIDTLVLIEFAVNTIVLYLSEI